MDVDGSTVCDTCAEEFEECERREEAERLRQQESAKVTAGNVLKLLKQAIKEAPPSLRLDMMRELFGGYCMYCGIEQPDNCICQCENDE